MVNMIVKQTQIKTCFRNRILKKNSFPKVREKAVSFGPKEKVSHLKKYFVRKLSFIQSTFVIKNVFFLNYKGKKIKPHSRSVNMTRS
jgi:hypothetical protein